MPRLQLETAITLVASAACSLGLWYALRSKEGAIHLPTHQSEESTELTRDPFDVTVPADMVDGFPINEEAFWRNARLRKLCVCALYAVVLAIQTISFGWAVANNESTNAITSSLNAVFALYLVVVAAHAIGQDTVHSHSESLLHICSLTTIAVLLFGAAAIIPDSPYPGSHTVPKPRRSNTPDELKGLWYTVLALYALALWVASMTPFGPLLHFPSERIYSKRTLATTTNHDEVNVCGSASASVWSLLMFSYTTKVVMLGNLSESLEIGDLPILPLNFRATFNYPRMKHAMKTFRAPWKTTPGSGYTLGWQLVRANSGVFTAQALLAAISACLFYAPALFLQRLVLYLQADPERIDRSWGWLWVLTLFFVNVISFIITGQLWSLSTTTIQVRLKTQLNSVIFAKTLVRKDVASSAATPAAAEAVGGSEAGEKTKDEEDNFSSKAQVMTLMTTDIDRVSDFSWHLFTLVDSPIEIIIGTTFLYTLLGHSCLLGLAMTLPFVAMNHFAGVVVVGAQENLMKARDERVALMNEILGGIRMLKFMAWERSFEKKVMEIREKELKYQKLNYTIETLFNALWNGSPILVTLVSFWHFTVWRGEVLTPAIAFTSITVFSEMKFALGALPETFIQMLQSMVSLRRIEKYLNGAEVAAVPPTTEQSDVIAFRSATVTWPQDRSQPSSNASAASSAAPTPRHKFVLVDLSLNFPTGELSLICGKLGSGKTLMLLALLGEADLLTGQMMSPRSPPDSLASFIDAKASDSEWIVPGICAYVPQAAWLRNASIKENILFNLPYDEVRYQKTLEVCALVADLEILEDGDESEIGERGVNVSGGQKARISLARAVYSRASVLLLDDCLSAVDAHTAHHLYHECLRGDLMKGRTVILVSHHVQLCTPGAGYIVALDNGHITYQGDKEGFKSSGVMGGLVQSSGSADDAKDEEVIEEQLDAKADALSEKTSTTVAPVDDKTDKPKAAPRKLVEEEKRSVGHISKDIWAAYIHACGQWRYWLLFVVAVLVAAASPVIENGWLREWAKSAGDKHDPNSPAYYIGVYAILTGLGLIITTVRWFVLYHGSITASRVLYKNLLESVLFANIRFHDTVSRGRLLNRFGKDFEGIDSSLSDNFGRSIMYGISAACTFITLGYVGGPPFILAAMFIGTFYWNIAKVYGQTSRDMRRLDSVTRSPLYSIYGETISGVTILRAFGASSQFLRDMLRAVDTNINPYNHMWGVNRWLSIRYNLLSSCVVGLTAAVAIMTKRIDASLAGFALAFASTVTNDLLFVVRRFVGLEQSMVALERVKEYSELVREAGGEFQEPRPASDWPAHGQISCQGLVIRYAPDLPNVLHNLSFEINAGEKVGILGRTGSGKSTLALSFFRFVEPVEGRILVDGMDIAHVGLSDLRGKLTIIPQDPTILSGTLRSTLDVFDEYEDTELFGALRRVHLIPSEETPEETLETVNANIFRNLDSPVSEGGDNFSTGEKQLLCMARAILKKSKVLVMDEATASVDYATDELISKTIQHEFADSTILTIAHRLRTVITYDRVMVLSQGRLEEFEKPSVLLADANSAFYQLCKSTGKEEFVVLKKMAGLD